MKLYTVPLVSLALLSGGCGSDELADRTPPEIDPHPEGADDDNAPAKPAAKSPAQSSAMTTPADRGSGAADAARGAEPSIELESPGVSGDGGLRAGTGAPNPDGGATDALMRRDSGSGAGAKVPPALAVAVGGAVPACKFNFCESFETGTDGATPPGWSGNGGRVDSARAAFGKKSLRVRNGGINPGLFISRSGVFPEGKNTVYVRMYMWFETRPATGGLVHWTAAEVRGAGGPAIRAIGGIAQANFQNRNNLLFNIDPGGGEKGTSDSFPKPNLPDKEWFCVEVSLTRGMNVERTWWNDQPRPLLDYNGTWGSRFNFPSFGSLSVGMATYQNVGAFDVFIDDIAVSDQRIGC